ncbi:Crp/Fnr family transcriptional regulator [Pokkaliibacter sp. CJK22405]|uniref:Crp/Fnr family transcriptional regulator n=1 Tax=Pokkaliibacter sp. CJK22405 TaxID=3384615 RepID=UPI0039853F75
MTKQLQRFRQQIHDVAGLDVLQTAALLEIPPQTSVFRQGERCNQFLHVVAGTMKVYGRTATGRDRTLYRVSAGESCLLTTSALLDDSDYDVSARSETFMQILAIPRAAFLRGIAESEDFRQLVFSRYGERLASLTAYLQALAFDRLDVTLARYLVDHQHHGRVPVSVETLAVRLDAEVLAVRQVLEEFEQRHFIMIGPEWIDVLEEQLLNYYVAEATA